MGLHLSVSASLPALSTVEGRENLRFGDRVTLVPHPPSVLCALYVL